MKAVVLEIRDGLAAVLREDGTVEKIPGEYRVGETVELADKTKVVRMPRKATRWAAAAAAALVIVSAGGGYGYNNAYAYSYVTLDADTSIEYVLNRRNRVIAVDALDEDGESLAAEVLAAGVKNSTLSDAMAATTEILYRDERLGEEQENCLLVNVSSRGEGQRQALTEEVSAYFSGREPGEELDVYVTNATRDEARRAEELGVSAGRYVLIRDIGERDGFEAEDGIDRFVGETVGHLLEESGRREPRGGQMPEAAPEGVPAPEPAPETGPEAEAGRQPGAMPEAVPAEEPADRGGEEMTPPDAAPESGQPEAPAFDGGTAEPVFDGGGASGEPS